MPVRRATPEPTPAKRMKARQIERLRKTISRWRNKSIYRRGECVPKALALSSSSRVTLHFRRLAISTAWSDRDASLPFESVFLAHNFGAKDPAKRPSDIRKSRISNSEIRLGRPPLSKSASVPSVEAFDRAHRMPSERYSGPMKLRKAGNHEFHTEDI